jgi:eukaryotic-like serine/threonine-protein kinase
MSLPPESWPRVKELFEAVVDLTPAERKALLEKVCANDASLRMEIESLLESDAQSIGFIEKPVMVVPGSLLTNSRDEEKIIGLRLGSYQIVREIGRGGLGVVYLAVRADKQFDKQVAIKLIKRGLDTDETLRRFRREWQILATLEHPNIARLIDVGATEDGLPYLVMEYVEGEPIADYCELHALSLRQRLELFRVVCAAVTYAHQHLVVHRDIKPSNILVTAEGEPKLLDFGIGKLLDSSDEVAALPTLTVVPVLTPEYASPEHVRGETITTASDIYSLGVLLYELLSGNRPYRIKTRRPDEIARAVTDTEPAAPSSVVTDQYSEFRKFLKGDLDNIVLMAMRKEPQRRYASAAQFSDDIRRHLGGLPIRARKDTIAYRSSKFVARHRVGVAAAALLILSLIGGLIATIWEARRAYQERTIAQRRFDEVRQLAHSLMFEIHDSVQNLAGATPTRRLIVTRALEYLDRLAREAQNDPTLQRELAAAYEKIGDIQGNPYSANLGDTDGALASYRKALAIRTNLESRKMGAEAQMELGRTYRGLGDILEQKGDVAGCVKNYRESLVLFQQLAATNGSEFAVRDELARAYETLGDGLARTANGSTERLENYEKALAIREQLLEQQPGNGKLRRSVGHTLLKIAVTDPQKPAAVEQGQRGAQMLEALAAENHDDARARREVGFAYYELGGIFVAAENYPAALESRKKAFAIREEIAREDPENAQAAFDLAVAHADLAEVLTLTDALPGALHHAQESLAILEQLSVADPSNVVYRRNIALCYEKFAQVYCQLGKNTNRLVLERQQDWKTGRDYYQKAALILSQLRAAGTLMPSDTKMPEEFAAKLTESDEAIRQLTFSLKQSR